jgi:hypothetical protein
MNNGRWAHADDNGMHGQTRAQANKVGAGAYKRAWAQMNNGRWARTDDNGTHGQMRARTNEVGAGMYK